MYQALYRSYRPETFQGLLGQDHIVRVLKNQLDAGTTGHAYLFSGTRGTGKTSTARILAKGLNCLAPQGERPCGECAVCREIAAGVFVDVIEIDAASNNGVENIRELRESVNYPPAAGRKKIYVIDEAHMLSQAAANALLKTLEEPPANIVFILATTEPQKLPATILSRCLRLDFHRVSEKVILERFIEICGELGVEAEPDALALIASNADGSVRDGLSLLDRCIAGAGVVTRERVLEFLGMCGQEVFLDLTGMVLDHQVGEALLLLDGALAQGKDVNQFARDWVEHFRHLLVVKYVSNPQAMLNMSVENIKRLQQQAERITLDKIKDSIIELSEALSEAKWSTRPRVIVELAIVRLASAGYAQVRPALQETEKPDMPVAARPKPTEPAAPVRDVPQAEPEALIAGPPQSESMEPIANPQRIEPEPQPVAHTGELSCEELWNRVMQDERISKMARTCGSVLAEITDHLFTVEVSNSIQEEQFKKEEKQLVEVVEEYTGRKRRLQLLLNDAETQESFL